MVHKGFNNNNKADSNIIIRCRISLIVNNNLEKYNKYKEYSMRFKKEEIPKLNKLALK